MLCIIWYCKREITGGSVVSFRCFERFFKYVNTREGVLTKKRNGSYVLENTKLIGYDYLWQVRLFLILQNWNLLFILYVDDFIRLVFLQELFVILRLFLCMSCSWFSVWFFVWFARDFLVGFLAMFIWFLQIILNAPQDIANCAIEILKEIYTNLGSELKTKPVSKICGKNLACLYSFRPSSYY